MQRITTVLKESEVMAVRKVVCIAGAEDVMVTPLPYRMCGIDMMDIHSAQIAGESDKHVRLDVAADNSRSGSIVSAIRRIAHAGRIIFASSHGALSKRTA